MATRHPGSPGTTHANPYKLVTNYDVVPEARGQQASLQLPYAGVGQQASLRLPHAMVVAMERDSIDRLFRSCEHTAMLASQPLSLEALFAGSPKPMGT